MNLRFLFFFHFLLLLGYTNLTKLLMIVLKKFFNIEIGLSEYVYY